MTLVDAVNVTQSVACNEPTQRSEGRRSPVRRRRKWEHTIKAYVKQTAAVRRRVQTSERVSEHSSGPCKAGNVSSRDNIRL
jgi:hypothetical protein